MPQFDPGSRERRRALEPLIGGDHLAQCAFVAAVAAVAIGMVAADEIGIGPAQRAAIGVDLQAERIERAPILARQRLAVPALGARRDAAAKARVDRIERIGEVRPSRRAIGAHAREGARLALPAGIGALFGGDLVGAHPREIIVALVEGADMIEAQPLPVPRPVEARAVAVIGGRAKFAGGIAARRGAFPIPLDTPVKARLTLPIHQSTALHQKGYVGTMTQLETGPVAAEIERRLRAALSPESLAVIDDSAAHRGHAGHDARGESHFTVEIVAAAFAGESRVKRHRLVNAALAALLADRVHALVIQARAPGE